MSDAQEPPKAAAQSGDLKINYVYPAEHHSGFANHFVVRQSAQGEFRLSFFEMREPIILGSKEERETKLAEFGQIDAFCVAEVVITKPRMVQVLAALIENLSKSPGKPEEKKTDASSNE